MLLSISLHLYLIEYFVNNYYFMTPVSRRRPGRLQFPVSRRRPGRLQFPLCHHSSNIIARAALPGQANEHHSITVTRQSSFSQKKQELNRQVEVQICGRLLQLNLSFVQLSRRNREMCCADTLIQDALPNLAATQFRPSTVYLCQR